MHLRFDYLSLILSESRCDALNASSVSLMKTTHLLLHEYDRTYKKLREYFFNYPEQIVIVLHQFSGNRRYSNSEVILINFM